MYANTRLYKISTGFLLRD